MRDEFNGFTQRIGKIVHRFESQAQSGFQGGRKEAKGSVWRTVWEQLKDLFTRDVSGREFREHMDRDLRDTFRFFTREIDFAAVRHLPRRKRYPLLGWQIFLALAYRLSPARRITFAAAVLLFFYGFLNLLQVRWDGSAVHQPGLHFTLSVPYWLISAVLFAVLLLLELRDKLDLKGDLSIAREIQFGLVPNEPFEWSGIHIRSFMRPANTVGGDYYDYIELDGKNRIGVVVADVSGKGMPAALMMALLQGSLRTLITAGFRGSELIGKLNGFLCSNIPVNSLVTLFYGELETGSGHLEYVNAGHNPPILQRTTGGLQFLSATALPLGILLEAPFAVEKVQLEPGERLLLYTDGVTEAFNEKDEEYGPERLNRFMQDHAHMGPEPLIQELVADVLRFCHTARPADDMTLMSITRKS